MARILNRQSRRFTQALALLASFSLPLAVSPVLAEAAAPPVQGYVMPDTEVWDLQSKEGVSYRIFVSRPSGVAPAGGYPVLYILDANAMFAGFGEARRIHSGFFGDRDKMVIIGIGYPIDKPYADRRMEDFTAPFHTPELAIRYKDYKAGGREAFLRFITDRLTPEVAKRYEVNTQRQSLYGHSLGGLFALYTLYTQPELFHAVIAASPSIWWDGQAILDDEAAFTQRLMSDNGRPVSLSRLLILVGENEETPVMVADSRALARRMEALSGLGLRSRIEVFDDEIHLTVPSRSVTPTLRAAMEWP